MSFVLSPTTGQRIVFPGKQQASLEPFEPIEPSEGEVRVRTEFTLMSTGTENIVFNRNFAPGTHWDNWIKYPFYPGYSCVGTVDALGPNVGALQLGERVALRHHHGSHAVVNEDACLPIPDGIPWTEAVWFSLAKIAFHGAHAAQYQLGDNVLIIGAGPIGQMSIRWARAAGAASITVVDPVPDRMKYAHAGGATATISVPIGEAREAVLAANRGRLPRVVVDTTGHWSVFASALTLADRFGKVVILGDTGEPDKQALTSDVIKRGLTIVGVHDGHNSPQWNNATITALFMSLAQGGRFNLGGLTTHTFSPSQCAEAYAMANSNRASTMGILFSWKERS